MHLLSREKSPNEWNRQLSTNPSHQDRLRNKARVGTDCGGVGTYSGHIPVPRADLLTTIFELRVAGFMATEFERHLRDISTRSPAFKAHLKLATLIRDPSGRNPSKIARIAGESPGRNQEFLERIL